MHGAKVKVVDNIKIFLKFAVFGVCVWTGLNSLGIGISGGRL
jgi:hypothetical protein